MTLAEWNKRYTVTAPVVSLVTNSGHASTIYKIHLR